MNISLGYNFTVSKKPKHTADGLVSKYDFDLASNFANSNYRLEISVHGKRKWLKYSIEKLYIYLFDEAEKIIVSVVIGKNKSIAIEDCDINLDFNCIRVITIFGDIFYYKRYDWDFAALAKNIDGARLFNEKNECVLDVRSPLLPGTHNLIVSCKIADASKSIYAFAVVCAIEVGLRYLRSLNS